MVKVPAGPAAGTGPPGAGGQDAPGPGKAGVAPGGVAIRGCHSPPSSRISPRGASSPRWRAGASGSGAVASARRTPLVTIPAPGSAA